MKICKGGYRRLELFDFLAKTSRSGSCNSTIHLDEQCMEKHHKMDGNDTAEIQR